MTLDTNIGIYRGVELARELLKFDWRKHRLLSCNAASARLLPDHCSDACYCQLMTRLWLINDCCTYPR